MTVCGKPRVTVITAAYNAASCLERAVCSVQAQTERDLEYIIVDDGSTDGTGYIASQLAKSDGRIRAIRLANNGGAAHALNIATQAARGKWVALLDADDWYDPERLERLLDCADHVGVQMVADNQAFYDEKAQRPAGIAFQMPDESRSLGLSEFIAGTDPTAPFDLGMLKPVFLTEFVRRRAVMYRENVRHGYDYFVLLDFFVAGGQALLLAEPLYWYVQPFGTFSRKWANENGRRYPFEHVKEMNDKVVAEMRDRIPADHLEILIRRGQWLDALARFHQLREQVREGHWLSASRIVKEAPFDFWRLCARRARSIRPSFGSRVLA